MKRTSRIYLALSVIFAPLLAAADGQWVLAKSTLTYHVSHPLHQSEGVSHEARGKGTCQAGQCNFLIAVPVKSFVSGDSNRDLHMLQVTRGAQFPLVTVRVSLPESVVGTASLHCDVGNRVCRPEGDLSRRGTSSRQEWKRGRPHGHHSGDIGRFQDRPTVAALNPGEK